jgi:hypothetical protein
LWNLKVKVKPVITVEDWNYLKVFHKIPERLVGIALHPGTTGKQPYWTLHKYCGKC